MPVLAVPIDRISPAAYNPRVDLKPGHPRYERIKRSIQMFGLVDPLVWNERSGNLVGGHQRFKIMVSEGATEIECSVVDLDQEQEKALNLILNSPDVEGEWDADGLAAVLEELEARRPDIFDEMELSLLSKLEITHDDAPGAEKKGEDEGEEPSGPPEMELLPYESYDYVVLMFRDSRDYIAALDHFGIQKASVPAFVGSKKIGLGRVLDGAKYLARVRRENIAANPGQFENVPVAAQPADPVADPIAAVDEAFAEAEVKTAAGKKRR